MATAHLRLCLQHKEHVAAKSSRNVLSVRSVVIEQALWGGATHMKMKQSIATKISFFSVHDCRAGLPNDLALSKNVE